MIWRKRRKMVAGWGYPVLTGKEGTWRTLVGAMLKVNLFLVIEVLFYCDFIYTSIVCHLCMGI